MLGSSTLFDMPPDCRGPDVTPSTQKQLPGTQNIG